MHAPTDLFSRLGPIVYRRARQLLGSHADAEDVTQEVFAKAIETGARFETIAEAYAWSIKAATNLCLNRIRDKRRRDGLVAERDSRASARDELRPSADERIELQRLLRTADARAVSAALHVYVDGLSHDEASAHLGVSRRTVGNLLQRLTLWARGQGEA